MDGIRILEAWAPGAIGGVAALHARHYAASHGFGAFFEAKVAAELGEFLCRLDPARDLFRCAMDAEGRVLGSIALDCGEAPGAAHLRWFILDGALRGRGLGARWLGEAMDRARALGLARVWLWTLDGLDAAAALYARAGFATVEEVAAEQWGRRTVERRMELTLRC
jgi:N-acetylglutamate synthase-like GNAT family acetyltransferase